MRIVDGKIVVDESSMQVDRQRIAQGQQGELVELEKTSSPRIVTCGTHMKTRKGSTLGYGRKRDFLGKV